MRGCSARMRILESAAMRYFSRVCLISTLLCDSSGLHSVTHHILYIAYTCFPPFLFFFTVSTIFTFFFTFVMYAVFMDYHVRVGICFFLNYS